MKRVLVLSSFPAPYRVDVFQGIARNYELDVIFGTDMDQNRSREFFANKDKLNYYVKSSPEDEATINERTSDLEQYAFVLAYDWYLPFAVKIEEKCIRLGIPYFINCDGAFLPTNKGLKEKIKNIIKKRYISHAYKCFASGQYAAKYFEYYGAESENIIIHPFSSLHDQDMINLRQKKSDVSALRKELGLKDKKTVISIGQFIHRKGFDILLEAWSNLDEEYQLIIIGGGDERPQYEEIIEKKEYSNVKIINFLHKEEIISYYKVADVFALATREDIWGLVIIEALAYGLPIVSTNRCIAACELIEKGAKGCIVECENISNFHDAIENMLALNYDGTSNIEIAREYTIENVVKSHLKAFNQIGDK